MANRRSLRARGLRRGFTLMEVLLALALLVTLLAVLGLSLRATLRATSAGRAEVAHAQLARAILRRIAADVRGAILYQPVDTSAILSAAGGAISAATAAGAPATPETPATGQAPTGAATATSADGAAASTDPAAGTAESTETAPPVPGIFGGSDWIEVDVSRIPAPQGYVFVGTESVLPDLPSEVKTVAYGWQEGLYRRELDRAITLWATENSALEAWTSDLQPLAAEVLEVAFRYYDGSQWATEWTTTEESGLPVAIEVAILLASPSSQGDAVWHTLVIDIPLGRPAEETAEAAESTDTGESAGAAQP